MTATLSTDILVIGYGNSLRGDDGIGPAIVEALGQIPLPGVRTLISPLLAPELADPVSRAREVIFVDASALPQTSVLWRPLAPAENAQIIAHAADPQILLALARDVFGHAPEAWWLTLPVYDMGFQVGLSPGASAHFQPALDQLVAHCRGRAEHISAMVA